MARGRTWTKEELEYLEDKWGVYSKETIAKKLNRTVIAIELKAQRLNLGSERKADGSYTAQEVASLLKIDTHVVTDHWIPNRGLKAKKVHWKNNRYYYKIKHDDLMKWLKENQDKWDSRKVELYALGEEYEWLKQKRQRDMKLPKKHKQKWTKQEENLLISYINMGLKQKEIAQRMCRSVDGIQRKIDRLRQSGKLPKVKIILRWTEEEEKLFRELEAKGLTDKEIAYELGREAYHIVDHRRNLRAKGLYKGKKMIAR